MSGLRSYGLRGVQPQSSLMGPGSVETIQGMKDWGATDTLKKLGENFAVIACASSSKLGNCDRTIGFIRDDLQHKEVPTRSKR